MSKKKCPIFGDGKKLPSHFLPTYEDIVEYYIFLKENSKKKVVIILDDVELLWQQTGIPILSRQRVKVLINSYINKYSKVLKSSGKDDFQLRCENFKESSKCFFDISFCKCAIDENCNCDLQKKVPCQLKFFLNNQRTIRNLPIPKTVLTKTRQTIYTSCNNNLDDKFMIDESENDYDVDDENEDTNYEPPKKKVKSSSDTNTNFKLCNVAVIADRYGTSDREAAAIVSCTLKDLGLIDNKNKSLVVDKNKIRRARIKERDLALSENSYYLNGFYFDGRKDRTMIHVTDGKTSKNITKTEEHISLISEPGSKYMGHLSPKNGSSACISKEIINFFPLTMLIHQILMLLVATQQTLTPDGNLELFH